MADIEFKRFKKLLQDHNHFVTMPRMRLFAALQKHPNLSLKELIKLVSKHDQVTIYRNVDLFEKLGIVNLLRLGWHTKIELSDIFRHHHHHFSCVNCGRIIILKENPLIEREIAGLSLKNQFKAMDHQLEIRGLCRRCQAELKSP